MDANAFVYWLQGALEMSPEMLNKGMTPEQAQTIQDHLNLVFNKVTPDRFKDKGVVGPQPLNWDFDTTGNPPPALPTTTCSDGGDLFCSQFNVNSDFEPNIIESMSISGCTNIGTGFELVLDEEGFDNEEDWTGGSTLLSSC